MTTTQSSRPPDDEIASAMLRLRAADPVREAEQLDVDPDSMLASVRGDRGRHRPGRARRLVPVLVAAAVVLIVAAGVAILPRVIGSPNAASTPTPIGLSASPNPTTASPLDSSTASGDNPIPSGARLPQLWQITLTIAHGSSKTESLGSLPDDLALKVARTLNTAEAVSSARGPVQLRPALCNLRPGLGAKYTLTLLDLQSRASDPGGGYPTTVATAHFDDSCAGFSLEAGRRWYGSSMGTDLFDTLESTVIAPASSLSMPSSINVSYLSTNWQNGQVSGRRKLGTLTNASAYQVWSEITSLSATEPPNTLCPMEVETPMYSLDLMQNGRAYAHAVVNRGCIYPWTTVQLHILGGPTYRLTYAEPVLTTLGATLHRPTR